MSTDFKACLKDHLSTKTTWLCPNNDFTIDFDLEPCLWPRDGRYIDMFLGQSSHIVFHVGY